jgi:hypothetical protein
LIFSPFTGWRTVSILGRERRSLPNSWVQRTQIKCIKQGAYEGLFLWKSPH